MPRASLRGLIIAVTSAASLSVATSDAALEIKGSPTERFMSWIERRDQDVVKQQWDYSCGIAALATLLHLQAIASPSERQLIERFAALSGQANSKAVTERLRSGYSLADLSVLAAFYGVRPVALRLTSSQLRSLKVPVIARLHWNIGAHFTVLVKAADEGQSHFVLADPRWGNRRMRADQFLDLWVDPISVPTRAQGSSRNALTDVEAGMGDHEEGVAKAATGLIFALVPVEAEKT